MIRMDDSIASYGREVFRRTAGRAITEAELAGLYPGLPGKSPEQIDAAVREFVARLQGAPAAGAVMVPAPVVPVLVGTVADGKGPAAGTGSATGMPVHVTATPAAGGCTDCGPARRSGGGAAVVLPTGGPSRNGTVDQVISLFRNYTAAALILVIVGVVVGRRRWF